MSSDNTRTGQFFISGMRRRDSTTPVAWPAIQTKPVNFAGETTGSTIWLKVDLALQSSGLVLIVGWITELQDFELSMNGDLLPCRKISTRRDDVAKNLGLSDAEGIGFVLIAKSEKNFPIELTCKTKEGATKAAYSIECTCVSEEAFVVSGLLEPAVSEIALAMRPFTTAWRRLIKQVPAVEGPCFSAKGFLDTGATSSITGDSVVVGWVVHMPESPVWLEDQAGRVFELKNCYRRFRQDVADAVGKEFAYASRGAGFIAYINGGGVGQCLYLKAASEVGVHTLGQLILGALPENPVAIAQWLSSAGTAPGEITQRVSSVDRVVIERIICRRQEIWVDLPVMRKFLGESVPEPKVSVIVPLAARTDLVEHQLLEFADDPWFCKHVELIYVIDDSQILERLLPEIEALYRIYRIPMSWAWGKVVRGTAGAYNLGASLASGEYLLFLNGDVFPRHADWIQPLVDVLETHSDIGAVAPRLLSPEGAIRHAGMEFVRRDELDIWVSHCPNMGLAPELDPHQGLARVPAITSACLLVAKKDFYRVGGWDTRYLMAEVEEPDFCLKLRNEKKTIAYLPTVQLTRLGGWSLQTANEPEIEKYMAIYNAIKRHDRWKELIEDAAERFPLSQTINSSQV
ncbi:glycosyltransferase [Bordetella petrii]|nr:glycosyltransferase [Bordetella petrii]